MAHAQPRKAAGPLAGFVVRRETLLLAIILAVGAGLRLYGLDWDGGHWLHPDERQIYFVTLGLGWPRSLAVALRPDSPLNPHFFAYGSLPIYLLKIVAALAAPLSPVLGDPNNLHLLGRPLAALFDLGTVYLTYRLARRVGGREGRALLAAALLSVALLSVQLAHFYTADTLLTFFVMLTLNFAADVARGAGRRRQVALGAALGLALATKVSAAPLFLVVLVALVLRPATSSERDGGAASSDRASSLARLLPLARGVALTGIVAAAVFILVQPYALVDWQTFLADTARESQIAWGTLDVPYTRQYAGTLPYLYSIWQTASWGLGLPLGLVAWAGLGAALIRWLRRGFWADTLLLAWAGPYLAIVGLFHARYLRYMLPLVPVLCLFAAWFLAGGRRQAPSLAHRVRAGLRWLVILSSLAYTLVLVSIYAVPHPWIVASQWIYRNVPAGSTLAVEDWDTTLPLPLDVDGRERRIEDYDMRLLPLYDEPDDVAKWSSLAADLADSEYVVVASRRLYASIPRQPARYPLVSRYYEQLFAGTLGFEPAGEFSRGPGWLNPPQPPLPDAIPGWLGPDESLVVYDHPRVLIFRNAGHLPAAELLRRLSTP